MQSLQTDYNTQQLLSSQAGSGHLLQPSHQKPPTHGFNSVGGPQAATRLRSPHLEMSTAKQKEFNLTAAPTAFAAQSLQPGQQHPPPSPGQQSSKIQVLATNHGGPKVKIQSSSLNRI